VVKRAALICLLIYQAIFLNVVLPGHTRGAITLTGNSSGTTTASCGGCCAEGNSEKPDQKRSPSGKDRENCALCHMAARITPAPAISLTLPKLGEIELLPVVSAMKADSLEQRLAYYGRAPPFIS
jgi:hypothetical protein